MSTDRLKIPHDRRNYLLHQYRRKRKRLFDRVGHTCVLCGGEANSLHHILPVAYADERFNDVVNSAINMMPCCHNYHAGKNCHFRLNGASWVVLKMYREYWNIWSPLRWIMTIKNWIFDHIDQLRDMRAAEIVRNDSLHIRYKTMRYTGNPVSRYSNTWMG